MQSVSEQGLKIKVFQNWVRLGPDTRKEDVQERKPKPQEPCYSLQTQEDPMLHVLWGRSCKFPIFYIPAVANAVFLSNDIRTVCLLASGNTSGFIKSRKNTMRNEGQNA